MIPDLNLCKGALVTGGAGFLGSHLCEFFIRHHIPVYAVDNFCTSHQDNVRFLEGVRQEVAGSSFTFIEADIINKWKWADRIKHRITHVFHFASPASPPLYKMLSMETLQANSVGLHHALNYATENKARVVFASTSEVYGDPVQSPQKESYWGNVNSFGERACYDEGKRYGEALIYSYNKKYKTQHGLVRIFNTYGPRMNLQDGRVVINFLVQAEQNEPLTIYGEGLQTRSFCYVTDLIDGIVRYALQPIAQPVNLGNDTEFSILELTKIIQKIFTDRKVVTEIHPIAADDPQQRRPSLELAKSLLKPWAPKVDLKDGLALTLKWFRETHPAK